MTTLVILAGEVSGTSVEGRLAGFRLTTLGFSAVTSTGVLLANRANLGSVMYVNIEQEYCLLGKLCRMKT